MEIQGLAHIAVGSRDGDRLAHIAGAARLLVGRGVRIVRVSSVYETQPVGLAGDRPLLNAALAAVTRLAPAALMRACLEIEMGMGRRRPRDPARIPDEGARPIDLDLLMFGDLILETPELTLPHPRMHLRRFVLQPLAEIAPAAVHPLLGRTIGELLEACGDPHSVERMAGPEAWWRADTGDPSFEAPAGFR